MIVDVQQPILLVTDLEKKKKASPDFPEWALIM
jgi:hypothetical protein